MTAPDETNWLSTKPINDMVRIALVVLVVFLISLLFTKWGEAAAAIGGIIGGGLGALGAVIAVKVAFDQQAVKDARKDAAELASIRQALRSEVAMIANQCVVELQSWIDVKKTGGMKDSRTARLPPLLIYAAMTPQFGRLSRPEIIGLIGFAGTLHDLSTVAESLARKTTQSPDDQETMIILTSNACCEAAKCLRAILAPDSAEDGSFLAVLDRCCGVRKDVREKAQMAHTKKPPAAG